MKKIAMCLCAVSIALSGLTAFAATEDVYYGSDNSVKVDTVKDYQTVLIRKKGTTDDASIVYVNQKSDGLGEVASFMLKADTADGDYVATFGNTDGQEKTIEFSVGERTITGAEDGVTLDTDNKMTATDAAVVQETLQGQEEGVTLYKKGFTFDVTIGSVDYDRVYLVSADGATCYGYFELNISDTEITLEPGAEICYGIQIYNIPLEKKDLNLYLKEVDAK